MDVALGARRATLGELVIAAAVVAFLCYFGWRAAVFVPQTFQHVTERSGLSRLDYTVFDGAATVVLDGNGELLYDPPALRARYRREVFGPSGPFVFPPGLAYLWTPLAAFGGGAGYGPYTALSLGLVAAVALISRGQTREPAFVLLTFAAVVSYRPIHIALEVGQPTIPMMAGLAAGLVYFRTMPLASGLGFGLLAIKPQFMLASAAFAFLKGLRPAGWAAFAVVAGAIILLPFAILGTDAFSDFVGLLSRQADADALQRGDGRLMYSLQGFLIQLTRHDVRLTQVLPLLIVAGVATALAARYGDPAVAALASILGGLLIFHSLIYDWVLVVPAAILVAFRPAPAATQIPTLAGLALLHIAASAGLPAFGRYSPQFWTPPAAMLLLVWLAVLPLVEARLRQDLTSPPGPLSVNGEGEEKRRGEAEERRRGEETREERGRR